MQEVARKKFLFLEYFGDSEFEIRTHRSCRSDERLDRGRVVGREDVKLAGMTDYAQGAFQSERLAIKMSHAGGGALDC